MNEQPYNRSLMNLDPRRAGQVKRYHTWPTIQQQSVAEHTFHVQRIYTSITTPQLATLLYIQQHDLGEIAAGDPPYPVKAQNPGLKKEITEIEDLALKSMSVAWRMPLANPDGYQIALAKIADLIEMAEFGLDEVALGSLFGWPVVVDTLTDVRKRLADLISADRRNACLYIHNRLYNFWLLVDTPTKENVLHPRTWMEEARE